MTDKSFKNEEAVLIPSKGTSPNTAICKQETADAYFRVIAVLDTTHRVIICADGLQWIPQQRKSGGAQRPWRPLGYFQSRDALIRTCACHFEQSDPCGMAILLALPDKIGGAA